MCLSSVYCLLSDNKQFHGAAFARQLSSHFMKHTENLTSSSPFPSLELG